MDSSDNNSISTSPPEIINKDIDIYEIFIEDSVYSNVLIDNTGFYYTVDYIYSLKEYSLTL